MTIGRRHDISSDGIVHLPPSAAERTAVAAVRKVDMIERDQRILTAFSLRFRSRGPDKALEMVSCCHEAVGAKHGVLITTLPLASLFVIGPEGVVLAAYPERLF